MARVKVSLSGLSRVGQLSILAAIILLVVPSQFASSKNIDFGNVDSSDAVKVNISQTGLVKNASCPDDLTQLTPLLLRDLPGYSNRVIQRTQPRNRRSGKRSYIITAGQAEFEPLGLPRIQYSSSQDPGEQPEQVFFTVVEKQYSQSKITTLQTYHWLFLTQTNGGWRMVMLFSRFGNSQRTVPAPPRESSDGIIGQGIQTWLRNCRAGTIKS